MAFRLRGRCGYPFDDPFKPTFHPDRLIEPERIKKPHLIFTCSMGELFDPNLDTQITANVLAEMFKECNHKHTFQILTKRPDLAALFVFAKNIWLGCSQDCRFTKAEDLDYIRELRTPAVRFVSFEPLLGPFTGNLTGFDWVIVGAQTKPTVEPNPAWVRGILEEAAILDIPVFLKDNLGWPEKRREFPIAWKSKYPFRVDVLTSAKYILQEAGKTEQ
jgi:protein gp37